jgi:hypothetical protein
MLMSEAREIIEGEDESGYMVSFEKVEGGVLISDYFPDKHAGEPLIETETEAWLLANKFARKTHRKCVNIYVINQDFAPVAGYKNRMIENR